LKQYLKKNQVPSHFKTKEELQKIGRIPVGSPIAKLVEKNRIYYLFDQNQSAPIPNRNTVTLKPTLENLAIAIYVVNRHAKTSPQPQKLYQLKTSALEKLMIEGKAQKVGLQQSPNPSKYHQQTCNTLVKVGEYGFHLLSTREDLQGLPHLGEWNDEFRNPTESFSLRQAISLLEQYVGITEKQQIADQKKPSRFPPARPRKPLLSPFYKNTNLRT